MVAISINNDMLPKYQLVRSMNFGWQDQYVFDVTANSQYAIASASDNLIRLYDLSTLQPATSLSFHQQRISKIKLFNDQFLFSASEDGKLARWDLRTSTTPVQVFDYGRPLSAFDINCNDSMAVVGTLNEEVVQAAELGFFDTRQTRLIHKFEESHGDDVTEIQCHPTLPSQLISCSTDGLINSYDVTDFDEEEALLAVVNSGSSVNKTGYFGPNAEYLFCLTHLETFSLHTLEGDLLCDYGQLKQLDGVDFAIDCNYDSNSQRLYLETGSNSGSISIFHVNIDELQLCQTLQAQGGHTDVVRSLYWNHGTQSILTGGEDGIMCAWQG
ncbi:WD40-repeat-containing domain protein [Chlamydoabsidia padenii]|nr:WD40-repeat-containing domain protein [Chlamydoabsidia padenii]